MVLYNEKNPYGFVPYAFAPCFIVAGRSIGECFGSVIEPYQRYIEGLLNGHLDEVNMSLHPPRVVKAGANMPANRETWGPGRQFNQMEAKDVQLLTPTGVTQNVMAEIEFLDVQAEKASGVNAMGMGVPRAGNVNRTLGGIQTQVAGSSSRLKQIVKNIEDYMIVPLLRKAYKIMQYHVQPGDWIPTLGKDQQAIEVGGEAFQKPVKFRMLASSKMTSKAQLGQILPTLAQFLIQGPFIQHLQGQKQTVDWGEFFLLMQDATGTARRYNLIRGMNEQELQAVNQPDPKMQIEMQKAQQDAQVRLQMGQMKVQSDQQANQLKSQTELQKVTMQMEHEKELADEESAREMMAHIAEQYLEKQKGAADARKADADIATKRELAKIKAQEMQMKMIFDAKKSEQDMQYGEMEHRQAVRHTQEKGAVDRATQGAQAQHDMAFQGAQSEQKLATQSRADALKELFAQEKHKMEMKRQAALARLKPRTKEKIR
jgi:hypothetical protein